MTLAGRVCILVRGAIERIEDAAFAAKNEALNLLQDTIERIECSRATYAAREHSTEKHTSA